MKSCFTCVSVLFLMLILPLKASAQLHVPVWVSNGMVIQRNAKVPIQGRANPGEKVKLTFGEDTYSDKADKGGQWRITLPSMEAGGPYKMTIAGRREQLKIGNVMVGDVWIASGQSNMEFKVAGARHAESEISSAHDTLIRHFKVPRSWSETPEDELAGGSWEVTSPKKVGDFTAVGYFFVRKLREHVDVPIGLINTTWGGSRIEPWMSADALHTSNKDVAALLDSVRARQEKLLPYLHKNADEKPQEDRGMAHGDPRWADPTLNDASWEEIDVPTLWEQAGYDGMDGIGWYRTSFKLSNEEAQESIQLSLGTIDNSDISWVNGQKVGHMEAYKKKRRYTVPASALQAGQNVVAVRVKDTGGGGGMYGNPDQLYAEVDGEQRSLAGTWKFNVGKVTAHTKGRKNKLPTLLYNKMIHPLLGVPIKGVLWYQGESNAHGEDAYAYRKLFTDMIQSWRANWVTDNFPFLFVQLANFEPGGGGPADDSWAVLRESQRAALELPRTAQAVTIDIGNPHDIHPRNKQDVGARLARAARKIAYDEDLVYSGPSYRSHKIKDGRVTVRFDHVGGGLVAKGKELEGFTIAGEGGSFAPAQARIEGDHIIVWSDRVSQPKAVRYAWKNNPEEANLYNEDGLPASPFRTDER